MNLKFQFPFVLSLSKYRPSSCLLFRFQGKNSPSTGSGRTGLWLASLASVAWSSVIAVPAMAQDESSFIAGPRPIMPQEITVLGTGSRQRVEKAGQSISVLGADELDAIQSPDLTRVLERLPGVTFTRNGGLGSFTGVRVRAAGSDQVLVLVDGIRVADVAAPGGGFDFGTLSSSGIGKVELLRGSNSVVWGSEAVGGVIAMTTRRIDDGAEASAEYGARDTVNVQAGVGMIESSYEFALTGGYTGTDGFSTAATGTEPDSFRQWRANGRAKIGIAYNLAVNLAGRYADSRLDFDGFSFAPPFGLIDTPEFSDIEEWSGRAGLEYADDRVHLDAGYAIYDIARANFNPDFGGEAGFASDGRQERVEARGRWNTINQVRFDFGAEHEWSRFETNFDDRRTANTTSGHALLGWYGKRATIAAGARIDDHSGFGSEVSLGANGSIALGQDWRVRASYGEGFKAPTLYQLFSDFGNSALSPERSRSYDIGIERGHRNDSLHFAVTAFRRDTQGLIDFVSCFSVSDPLCGDGRFGFYQNVGKTRAEGFEVELAAQVSQRFHAQAAYSFVRAKDRTQGSFNRGNDLARRPRHAVSVALDWETPLAGLELGADLRMVSGSYDDAGNFVRLDPYALGTVRASLPVSDAVELLGRIENIANEDYQTAAGYGTPGRSAYLGARARF